MASSGPADVNTYAALDHGFTIDCDHEELAAWLQLLLRPLRVNDVPETSLRYELFTQVDTNPGAFRLRVDGATVWESGHPGQLVTRLVGDINLRAAERTIDHPVLHAAACGSAAGTLLLPGPKNAGKSTLVLGLALRGFEYLTDELAAIDGQQVRPYPRCVSLDPGSWPLFEGWQLPTPASVADFVTDLRFVDAAQTAPITSPPREVAAVVCPRYQPGVSTQLHTLDPVDGLAALLGSSFTLERNTQRDLDRLAGLLEHTESFELIVGSLDEACEVMRQHFGGRGSPSSQ